VNQCARSFQQALGQTTFADQPAAIGIARDQRGRAVSRTPWALRDRRHAASSVANKVPGMARVFVITGPSGVGKGTLIRGLMERIPSLELSVSATTRAPRPGERDGVDYHFLTREEFHRRIAEGDFVEHADYAGRSYGTLRSELEERLRAGVPVVLEIEVQGARQVRAAMPEAVQVFIAPPSLQALRTRLIGRGTDDAAEVERRLQVAEQELAAQPEFAHVVVNDRLEDALERLSTIVATELA
jgi:guanylate kinase